MKTHRGFTLVEMLVVLVIVGLMSGVAVLSLPGREESARDAALRLAARATLLAEESIIEGVPTGLDVNDGGYRLFRFREGIWQPITDERAFAAEQWRDGISIVVDLKEAGTRRASSQVSRTPSIVFDSSGFATPFDVAIVRGERRYVVAGDSQGNISVKNHDQK